MSRKFLKKSFLLLLCCICIFGGMIIFWKAIAGNISENKEISSMETDDASPSATDDVKTEGLPVQDKPVTESLENEMKEEQKIVLSEFSGTVNCVGNGELLLVGERVMLVDSCTLEVQRETENTAPFLVNPQADRYEDAYRLMGTSSAEWFFTLVEYDRNLHVKQIIDIEEASASEREIMACKLIPEENKILYNNINGLYLFDISSGERKDLTQDGIFIYDFACLKRKEGVLFIGSDDSGERVLGMVSMDGERLQEENADHSWGELWTFGDYALIEEAELVGKEKEGLVFRYDVNEGIRSFPLTDSAENGNITTSCNGTYYATRTYMQDDELRYVIRIYSSEDGSLIKELPLTYEEYGEDFRLMGYLICDDVSRIILYGTWRGQETDAWIVSKNL